MLGTFKSHPDKRHLFQFCDFGHFSSVVWLSELSSISTLDFRVTVFQFFELFLQGWFDAQLFDLDGDLVDLLLNRLHLLKVMELGSVDGETSLDIGNFEIELVEVQP